MKLNNISSINNTHTHNFLQIIKKKVFKKKNIGKQKFNIIPLDLATNLIILFQFYSFDNYLGYTRYFSRLKLQFISLTNVITAIS